GLGVAANGGASSPSRGLPQGDDPVHLDPADFSANVDNPQWPMTVGSRWVYRVLDYSDRSVKHEVTRDWYAQDKCGNVWYFGEHTVEYVHGHPRDNGSWEAGVDGNLPGVALP